MDTIERNPDGSITLTSHRSYGEFLRWNDANPGSAITTTQPLGIWVGRHHDYQPGEPVAPRTVVRQFERVEVTTDDDGEIYAMSDGLPHRLPSNSYIEGRWAWLTREANDAIWSALMDIDSPYPRTAVCDFNPAGTLFRTEF